MIIRLNKRVVFWTWLSILMVLLFFKYAFELNIPPIILSLVIIFIALCGNQNEILAISLCCISLHSVVDFYLVIGVCTIIYIFKNFRNIKIGFAALLGATMIVWEFLHCFAGEFSLKTTFGALIVLIYLIVIISSDVSNIDYPFVIETLAAMSIGVSVMILTNCIVQSHFNFGLAMASLQRLGELSKYTEASINPNTLGVINVITISGLLQIHINDKMSKKGIVMVFVLLIIGLLTSSRTFLVLLCIMMVMMILGMPGNIIGKIRYSVALMCFLVLLVLVYRWIFPYNFDYFVSRLLNANMLNGRDTIIFEYNEYLANNIWVTFFGVGLSNFGEKVLEIYKISTNVPHNGIQETIVAWGIFGILFLVCLILVMVIDAKRYIKSENLLNFIPLIVVLAKSMAGQFITSGYTMLILVLAYLSLCYDFSAMKKLDAVRL